MASVGRTGIVDDAAADVDNEADTDAEIGADADTGADAIDVDDDSDGDGDDSLGNNGVRWNFWLSCLQRFL